MRKDVESERGDELHLVYGGIRKLQLARNPTVTEGREGGGLQ